MNKDKMKKWKMAKDSELQKELDTLNESRI